MTDGEEHYGADVEMDRRHNWITFPENVTVRTDCSACGAARALQLPVGGCESYSVEIMDYIAQN